MAGTDSLDELAAELDRIAERLADAAMDVLRAGLGDGTEEAAALATQRERLVNRARSSVEKAVSLLAQATAARAPTATRTARGLNRRGRAGEDEDWDSA
ncbi:MAG: hypothetical protein WAL04_04405 [Acidimicrobiales bacterium]|jgi:hypothetical protein